MTTICNYCKNRNLEHNHPLRDGDQIVCPALLATEIPKTCSFCKGGDLDSNHPMRDHNNVIICQVILVTECTYCMKMGHTKKYCSVLKTNQLKNTTMQDMEKNEKKNNVATNIDLNFSADSYASKTTSNLTKQQDLNKIKQHLVATINKNEHQLSITTIWESKFVPRMFGRYGEYWPFLSTGTKLGQHKIAETARTIALSEKFHNFLEQEYGKSWLQDSVDSSYECEYIQDLRLAHKIILDRETKTIVDAETSRIQSLKDNMLPDAFNALMDSELETFALEDENMLHE